MNTRLKVVLKRVIEVARWYLNPTGIVTLLLIVAAFVAVLASKNGLGLGIVVVWLAVILPYKFVGEREQASGVLGERAKRLELIESAATDHVTRIAKLEAEVARLASDIAMSPTLAETEGWLDTLAPADDSASP